MRSRNPLPWRRRVRGDAGQAAMAERAGLFSHAGPGLLAGVQPLEGVQEEPEPEPDPAEPSP